MQLLLQQLVISALIRIMELVICCKIYCVRHKKGSLLLTETETFLYSIKYLKVAEFCKIGKHQPTMYDLFFKYIWR